MNYHLQKYPACREAKKSDLAEVIRHQTSGSKFNSEETQIPTVIQDAFVHSK